MIDLSVIIPVFNAELYIKQAINSVIAQLGINIEIIIVNDGSTDNSLEVIQSIPFDQIHIINTPNNGAAAARNIGLINASGKYIMFLDADDYLDDHSICASVLNIIIENNLDIVIFSYKYKNEESGKITKTKKYSNTTISQNGSAYLSWYLIKDGIFPASSCYRIIKKDFLVTNKIFFKEGFYSEDIEWCTNILSLKPKAHVINQDAYVYRKAHSTSVTSIYNEKKCNDFISIIISCCNIIEKITDKKLQYTLYSAIAYEYCILMGYTYLIKNKELSKQTHNLKWLLNYTLFPNVKYIYISLKLFGFSITSLLLSKYITLYANSKI